MNLRTLRLGPDGFDTAEANEADTRDILFVGRWTTPPVPDNRQALHVLDLEPDEGAFACWAYMRFGGPWTDCLMSAADSVDQRNLLLRNLPPPARIIESVPENARYDVVHAGEDVEGGLVILERCKPDWYAAEWNSERDRKRIDAACEAAGLRMFKIEMRDADTGRGLWLRSAAVWVDGNYRMKAA